MRKPSNLCLYRGSLHIMPRIKLSRMGSKAFLVFAEPFFSSMWCSWLPLISLWMCHKTLKILHSRIHQKEDTYESTQRIGFPFDNLDSQNYLSIPITPESQCKGMLHLLDPRISSTASASPLAERPSKHSRQLHLAHADNGRSYPRALL